MMGDPSAVLKGPSPVQRLQDLKTIRVLENLASAYSWARAHRVPFIEMTSLRQQLMAAGQLSRVFASDTYHVKQVCAVLIEQYRGKLSPDKLLAQATVIAALDNRTHGATALQQLRQSLYNSSLVETYLAMMMLEAHVDRLALDLVALLDDDRTVAGAWPYSHRPLQSHADQVAGLLYTLETSLPRWVHNITSTTEDRDALQEAIRHRLLRETAPSVTASLATAQGTLNARWAVLSPEERGAVLRVTVAGPLLDCDFVVAALTSAASTRVEQQPLSRDPGGRVATEAGLVCVCLCAAAVLVLQWRRSWRRREAF